MGSSDDTGNGIMDVFLGSSKDLSTERLAFGALMDSLADVALDVCGNDVAARMWETESYAMERIGSKQEAYDDVIRASDLVFILVGEHLGDYTLHEYLVAAEAMAACGTPRVHVWVRPRSPQDPYDENTRQLLAHMEERSDVGRLTLASEGELLLDMTRLVAERLGGLPLERRGTGLWYGHMRLVDLAGVPQQAVAAWDAWHEGGKRKAR